MLPLKICLSPSDQLGKCCRALLLLACCPIVAAPEPDYPSARYLFRTAAYLSVTDVTAALMEMPPWGGTWGGAILFAIDELSIQLNFESSADGVERRPWGVARPSAAARPGAYASSSPSSALIYFALAKIGLMLASINPSASPIWPSTGVALAAMLLRGLPDLAGDPDRGVRRQLHDRRVGRHLARHRRRQHDRRAARRLPDHAAVGRQGDLRQPGRRRPLRAAVVPADRARARPSA